MPWYRFNQNNSGGEFVVNNALCHRLLIEADNYLSARLKAEELGCYWNGVRKGIDCQCCGDRWNDGILIDMFDLEKNGVIASCFGRKKDWLKTYGKFNILIQPRNSERISPGYWTGRIAISNIEEYGQWLANTSGLTIPDVRIFYKDGTVHEIYDQRF